MRDNDRSNAYAHIQHCDAIAASQQDRMTRNAAEHGSRALLRAMLAYYRKHHGVKA